MTTSRGSNLTVGAAAALIAGVTLGTVGAGAMPVFIDDFADRFGMSNAAAGLVAAAQLTATAVVTLLLARRATGPGRVRTARIGLIVAAAGSLLAAVGADPVTLIVANLLTGAGLGAVYATATAALAATDDPDKASTVTVSGAVCVTALLIMAVSAVNGVSAGAGFILMALCCVPAWFLIPHIPDGRGTATPGEAAPAARPSIVLLAGTAVLWAVTQGAWSYASTLGREHTQMSAGTLSVVLAVSSVVALAGAVLGPRVAHRFGRMGSMTAFVAGQAVSMAVLITTDDPVLFCVVAVLWQGCQLAVLVQMIAAAAVIDPSGRLVASLGGANALGAGAGPLVVGMLLESVGAGALSVVLALGTLIASLPLLRMTVASGAGRAYGSPSEDRRTPSVPHRDLNE